VPFDCHVVLLLPAEIEIAHFDGWQVINVNDVERSTTLKPKEALMRLAIRFTQADEIDTQY